MIHPLFLKRRLINYNSLLDMKADNSLELSEATLAAKNNKTTIDKSTRSTKIKLQISPNDYPDITIPLLDLISEWDETLIPSDFKVGEFNYLIYEKGDHFKKHRDRSRHKFRDPTSLISFRVFSTSTLISQSADFEGGELIIYDNDGNEHNADLQVGETVFFKSTIPHQVNEVTRGTREVLVSWVWIKNDVHKYTNII